MSMDCVRVFAVLLQVGCAAKRPAAYGLGVDVGHPLTAEDAQLGHVSSCRARFIIILGQSPCYTIRDVFLL